MCARRAISELWTFYTPKDLSGEYFLLYKVQSLQIWLHGDDHAGTDLVLALPYMMFPPPEALSTECVVSELTLRVELSPVASSCLETGTTAGAGPPAIAVICASCFLLFEYILMATPIATRATAPTTDKAIVTAENPSAAEVVELSSGLDTVGRSLPRESNEPLAAG